MIPKVTIKPSIEDVQEALVMAGKYMTNVSKGVGQWTGGKEKQVGLAPTDLFHPFSPSLLCLFLFFLVANLFTLLLNLCLCLFVSPYRR